MATNYSDLQEKAKKLGIPYAGMSKKDLAKAIAEKENELGSEVPVAEPPVSEESSHEPLPNKEPAQEEQKDKDEAPLYNAALVFNGATEVRRYTKKMHGESFSDLAEQFAEKHDYTVKRVQLKPGIKCPACGHEFHPM